MRIRVDVNISTKVMDQAAKDGMMTREELVNRAVHRYMRDMGHIQHEPELPEVDVPPVYPPGKVMPVRFTPEHRYMVESLADELEISQNLVIRQLLDIALEQGADGVMKMIGMNPGETSLLWLAEAVKEKLERGNKDG